jgi:hypothetical protein
MENVKEITEGHREESEKKLPSLSDFSGEMACLGD